MSTYIYGFMCGYLRKSAGIGPQVDVSHPGADIGHSEIENERPDVQRPSMADQQFFQKGGYSIAGQANGGYILQKGNDRFHYANGQLRPYQG